MGILSSLWVLCCCRIFAAITKSHPQRNEPFRSDLDKILPSILDIQSAFVKLRQICILGELHCGFKVVNHHKYPNTGCSVIRCMMFCFKNVGEFMTLYSFLHIHILTVLDVQIPLRSLRRGGFQLLKTHDGLNMSGMQTS